MKRVRAVVSGRVQGVWFRAHTRDRARQLGVRGYVRNQPDGTVEIVATGDPDPVDALMDWARIGPPSAAVSELRISSVADEREVEYSDFEIRY